MTDQSKNPPLVMARRKSVGGHYLNAGTPLVITAKPSAPGEVTQAVADMLAAKRIAIPLDEVRPTPVETKEQEAARLMAEARAIEASASAEAADAVAVQADLVSWQADDAEAKAKKGDRVSNDHLRLIAAREGVAVESDDNKADLQSKIMAARALSAPEPGRAE